MVQLLLIYYVVFASASLNPVLVASVAFGINSGAYITEIFRSGINSVPKGQMEAARCLGLNTATSMKSVVVPQALRNILPALGNESISLLKETSIAGFIGVIDLTRAADIIRGQTYDALVPLIAVAIIYLAIVLILQFHKILAEIFEHCHLIFFGSLEELAHIADSSDILADDLAFE